MAPVRLIGSFVVCGTLLWCFSPFLSFLSCVQLTDRDSYRSRGGAVSFVGRARQGRKLPTPLRWGAPTGSLLAPSQGQSDALGRCCSLRAGPRAREQLCCPATPSCLSHVPPPRGSVLSTVPAERSSCPAQLLQSRCSFQKPRRKCYCWPKNKKIFFFPLLCALKISCSPAAFNRKHPPCLHTGVALQMLGTSRAGGRGGQPRAGGRSGPVCPGDRELGGWMQPLRAAGSGIHHCQVQFVFACRETSRGGGSTAEKGRCLLKRKCLNAV